jgi:hypothetical protein
VKVELGIKIEPGVKTKTSSGSAPPLKEWRAWYSMPPVYRHLEYEGWAGHRVALAKSAAEAGIMKTTIVMEAIVARDSTEAPSTTTTAGVVRA